MSAPIVSVVVCAYSERRMGELAACIESLRMQSLPPSEVLVVIDSNSDLLDRVRRALPEVAVVPSDRPRGLSGARNTGVALAGGDIVAFLDDDAEAAPDWLERLAAPYAEDAVLGVGGAVEPLWRGGRPGWFPPEFDWVVGCGYHGLPTEAALVRNFIGANMSFRREVLQKAGGFRVDLGRVGANSHGCEETELCIRIARRWRHGLLLYEPAARVRHHVSQERASWPYFRTRCYAEGVSKAAVASLVGLPGLSSERAHALRVLPRGIVRGLRDAVTEADGDSLRRALAIAAGLAATSAGYAVGAVRFRSGRTEVRTG